MTVLGNLTINQKSTHIYESIDSFSEAIEISNIKILRFEESIYYANVFLNLKLFEISLVLNQFYNLLRLIILSTKFLSSQALTPLKFQIKSEKWKRNSKKYPIKIKKLKKT
jgi:hypothetical protein